MSLRKSPSSDRKLVGNLTVGEARHLLRAEGGELTAGEIAWRVVAALGVSALTARAIVVGEATAWHLALPMVAQYLAIMAALPVLYVVSPHPDLRGEAIKALGLWAGLGVVAAAVVAVRAWSGGQPWQSQLASDAAAAWRWIADAKMPWPIAAAFAGELAAVPARVRNLRTHGPPFVGVSLGCAMQVAVLALGLFVLPWAVTSAARLAWSLWALLLIAELLALAMHWDVQRKLRQLDAEIERRRQ